MNVKNVGQFIKKQRKLKNMTQAELAEKLFVTEKAISRWETGRGTPDISLLIPLSNVLDVSVSSILNGENNSKENINDLIDYIEINKRGKYNLPFKISIVCYILSILIFLIYLKLDYNTNIELNYFVRLILIIISSFFIVMGNYIFSNNYIDKISDRKKIKKISNIIIFIYYSILMFNMTVFARYNIVNSYNLIPFKTIIEIIRNGTLYSIIINIFGNLLVFMPMEYFLIEIFNINKFHKNFIISFIIVILFEVLQFIFKIGVFDIDDIILCLFGMMLFYLLYNKILYKYQSKFNKK